MDKLPKQDEIERIILRRLIDVTVQKHAETEKAVLVSDDGDKSKAVWIPKSQCEIEPKARVLGEEFYELTLPEWLAKDKGLI